MRKDHFLILSDLLVAMATIFLFHSSVVARDNMNLAALALGKIVEADWTKLSSLAITSPSESDFLKKD